MYIFFFWQKKRCKMKGGERASVTSASCSPDRESVSVPQFLPTTCDTSNCSSREGVAEGSAEGSSFSASSSSSSSSSSTASDEPGSNIISVNGHCVGLNNGQLPMAKSKIEKRSFKRRRSKVADQQPQPQSHGHYGAGLLHTPIPVPTCVMPTLQQLMKGKQELGMGTFGVTAVTGHVWEPFLYTHVTQLYRPKCDWIAPPVGSKGADVVVVFSPLFSLPSLSFLSSEPDSAMYTQAHRETRTGTQPSFHSSIFTPLFLNSSSFVPLFVR